MYNAITKLEIFLHNLFSFSPVCVFFISNIHSIYLPGEVSLPPVLWVSVWPCGIDARVRMTYVHKFI